MYNKANPFGTVDYIVFAAILVISASTGVYHAFVKGGASTTSRYMVADRKLGGVPAAFSVVVSFVSAITVLGYSSIVFVNGISITAFMLSLSLVMPFLAFVMVPVFYDLRLVTAYEYLGLRFNLALRLIVSSLFIVEQLFLNAVFLLSPAIAVEAVQNFAIWKSVLILGLICCFYTTLGGISAVIWADVFQALVIFGSLIAVSVLGSIRAGGIDHVFEVNADDGRLDYDFSLDPTVRFTFCGAFFGLGVNTLSTFLTQPAIQRFVSIKSLKQAKLSAVFTVPISFFLIPLTFLIGFIAYAYYSDNPDFPGSMNSTLYSGSQLPGLAGNDSLLLTTNMTLPTNIMDLIESPDQIVPFFISSEFGKIPGIQGLFLSCLTAGALSSVSSSINSMATVTIQDFVNPLREWRAQSQKHALAHNDAKDLLLVKILCASYGIAGILLSFGIQSLENLIPLTHTFVGSMGGPCGAVFVIGMLCKRANGRGTLIGTITGILVGLWMVIGGFMYKESKGAPVIYKISFAWYGLFTFTVVVVVSLICSEVVRCIYPEESKREVNPLLLTPYLRPKNRHHVSNKENDEVTTYHL